MVRTDSVVTGQPAEKIYTNGRIYTVHERHPWAEAVAFTAGRFVGVGSCRDIARRFQGPDTRIVDLGGRMVMPGIHDMHVHPPDGGSKELECQFPSTSDLDHILACVSAFTSTRRPGELVRGGEWDQRLITRLTRQQLDAAAPHNPVLLFDCTFHAAWLNSQALALVGYNSDTPDPSGGQIIRDSVTGTPTGVLLENAVFEAQKHLPPYSYTPGQMRSVLSRAVKCMNSFGVTAMKDAWVTRAVLEGYAALDRTGDLTMRVPTSLVWDRQSDKALAESRGLIRDRRKYASPDIHTEFVKIMLDGAPPLQTAAMLQPYRSCNGHGETHRGYLLQSPESLASDVMMLDAEGLTVKIHAAGDWSVRVALDAFAAARKANGNWHLLHEVAHCNMIDPLDIPRFKELNVVAECSPIRWYPTPLDEEEENLLGRERLNRFYPIKSLIESGALVVYGSDWPFVSSGPSPWPGIEGMITRKDPSGSCPGALGEDQAVDLRTALRMVTLNGAISMYAGDSTGSIEVGKSADFIVLDRNLFEIPPEDIADIRVEMTVFKGNTVYGADGLA